MALKMAINGFGRIGRLVYRHGFNDPSLDFVAVIRWFLGYVAGHDIKEPAVKTLNSIVGALSADVILNQFTQRQPHHPIWVLESNQQFAIYADHDSVNSRAMDCFFCS